MKRKAALYIAFWLTVVAVLVFASLWPQRQVVAWVLLAVFGPLALVLIVGEVKRMSRYHHEAPGEQRKTKESYIYEQ